MIHLEKMFVLYSNGVRYSNKTDNAKKMCLNETYSRVRVDKYLSDVFPIKNILKQGDIFRHCFSGWLEIKWYTSASVLC